MQYLYNKHNTVLRNEQYGNKVYISFYVILFTEYKIDTFAITITNNKSMYKKVKILDK